MIWCKNYNWERWYNPKNWTYKPSKEVLELREIAKKMTVVNEQ